MRSLITRPTNVRVTAEMQELLLLVVAIVPVMYYLHEYPRDWTILDPVNTFWLGYLYFYVVQPLARQDDWVALYGAVAFQKALLLSALAGAGVLAGTQVRKAWAIGMSIPVIGATDVPRRYLVLAPLLVCGGLSVYMYASASAGGFEQYISQSRLALDYSTVSLVVLNFSGLLPFGLLIAMSYAELYSGRTAVKAVVFGTIVLYGAWIGYTGSRSGVILATVIAVAPRYAGTRRLPSLVPLALIFIVLFGLVGFLGSYRDRFYAGKVHLDEPISDVIQMSYEVMLGSSDDYLQLGSEFGMTIAGAALIPSLIPFDGGRMITEVPMRLVPRSIWPDKRYPEGEAWDRFHRAANTANWINGAGLVSGPAPGFVCKYYYMGGVTAVIAGGLLSGMLFRALSTYVARYRGIGHVVAAVAVCQLGFTEVTHPLMSVVAWVPAFGVPLVGVLWCCRTHGRGQHVGTDRKLPAQYV